MKKLKRLMKRATDRMSASSETSGKQIAFVCAATRTPWSAKSLARGIGGSEEAVIHLSSRFAKAGYDVTVFNDCGSEAGLHGDVLYVDRSKFNAYDKLDYVILWRSLSPANRKLRAKKVVADLHDVAPEASLSKRRMPNIDKVFVKSRFHRACYPHVGDEKFAVVPNGIEWANFQAPIEKDPMLLVNTSSPDRSLSTLVRLFAEVKKQVPEAKCKWAYGWDNFDKYFFDDPDMAAWKQGIVEQMQEIGIENLGRISQDEVAALYMKGNIFAYPTEFTETDCISARKAQAAGAYPITTNVAALNETVVYGEKIPATEEVLNRRGALPYDHSLMDASMEAVWVEKVVERLKSGKVMSASERAYFKRFDWDEIAKKWLDVLTA